MPGIEAGEAGPDRLGTQELLPRVPHHPERQGVVVVYHVTIIEIGHGLLEKC